MIEVAEVGTVKLDRIAAVLAGIPGGMREAIDNALKRAAARSKTEAGRYVANEYTMSQGNVRKNVQVRTDATGGGGSVSLNIVFRGTAIKLIEFKTRASKTGGVYAQVKKGGGGTLGSAFEASMKSGHKNIFARVGTKRLPIEGKYGPSVPSMIANETIVESMTETVREEFDRRIEHEVYRLLNGFGG